jgi:probable DNA metabolism protein
MLNYIYDGSFEGLLSCIYEAYYRHENPDWIIPGEMPQLDMLDKNIHISTDEDKAAKVYDSILNKISDHVLDDVYYAFLSEVENSGKIIYEYLKLGWKMGVKIDLFISDDRVLNLHKVSEKVRTERHRMLGLIRFSQCKDGIYYSQIEPDHNILQLLAPHFANRMADQNWIIHDIKRNSAAIYNMEGWILTNLELKDLPVMSLEEDFYQSLWKQYFKSIAITTRLNSKLQVQHMPKRYWNHLVEISPKNNL